MYKLEDDGKYFLFDAVDMIIERASEELSVKTKIVEVFLHGSQLSDKEYPNDIDVYIQLDFENISNVKKEKLAEAFFQKIYSYQSEFKGLNIDFGVGIEDFTIHHNKLANSNYSYKNLPYETISYH